MENHLERSHPLRGEFFLPLFLLPRTRLDVDAIVCGTSSERDVLLSTQLLTALKGSLCGEAGSGAQGHEEGGRHAGGARRIEAREAQGLRCVCLCGLGAQDVARS